MTELRFDGRVAIVTGAGGRDPSLGRSHASLLAERGAKVVINDLGVGPDGRGIMRANAEQVAEQIRADGGEAVADLHSVADEDGARSVVATALDTWGRVDILINNAGICFMAHFDEISDGDIRNIIDVHLMGTIWMCRAAWPHMREAEYGRIVNTTSGAMFGIENLSIYGAAKSGIFGLTRGLAVEGTDLGIKVNALGPAANTTAIRHFNEPSPFTDLMEGHFPVGLVSPAVAYLAHESCRAVGSQPRSGCRQRRPACFRSDRGINRHRPHHRESARQPLDDRGQEHGDDDPRPGRATPGAHRCGTDRRRSEALPTDIMTLGTAKPSVFEAGLPVLTYDITDTPQDIYPQFRAAQQVAPIALGPVGPEVLSYELARTVLRDPRFGIPPGIHLSAHGITSGPLWDRVTRSILCMEGDEHRRLRGLVSQGVHPAGDRADARHHPHRGE